MFGMISQDPNVETNAPIPNAVKIGKGGTPVVILHGWGQSLESVRQLGELLGRFGEAHLIDLPGFGLTPKPPSDWDTKQYAEFVLKYLNDNQLDLVDLVGHSFGGNIAIRLTSKCPARVRSLILINSGGLKRTQTLKGRLRVAFINVLRKVIKRVDRLFNLNIYETWFVNRFGSRDYKNAGPLRNILVKTVNEDVSDDAKKITTPTFILWGEKDEETPIEMAQRLHQLITSSKLTVLPGKDHYPFSGAGAHLCAHYILKFKESLHLQQAISGEVHYHA